jgi:hypothetical protein
LILNKLYKINVMSEFTLKKIKIGSDGKVNIIYLESDTSQGAAVKDVIERVSDRIPHPDLTMAVKRLTPFLIGSNSLMSHRLIDAIKTSKAEKTQIEKMEPVFLKLDEVVRKSVEVSGLAISGSDDNICIIITGKHYTGNTAVAINSPKLHINGDTWGFESKIEDVIFEIIEEAKAFVIDRKSAQLQMKFDDEEKDLKVA